VATTQGFLIQNSLQFAGSIFGGDARDVRLRPEMRMFVPISKSVVMAGRGVLGLLLPRNYGQTLGENFLTIPNEAAARPYIRDLQLTYFRGFFSGGADSNRGYGYREIGPHGVNPLIIPGTLAEEQARCNPANPLYQQNLCLVATGGLTLWEASLELRAPVYGDLGGVLFVDASDVSTKKLDVRLYVPHLSVGFGIRYPTPVGPLRVDIGYRIPGAQRIGAPPDPTQDGPPPNTFLGMPIALSIGLGEAY
jgi:outer membrane protein insertion porin family/translocation and assembly module TamA